MSRRAPDRSFAKRVAPYTGSTKMNLKQLSEKLGLSQTTVSRALNGYSDVSEATRQRVAEMAAACGYRPNTMARRLAMGRADESRQYAIANSRSSRVSRLNSGTMRENSGCPSSR